MYVLCKEKLGVDNWLKGLSTFVNFKLYRQKCYKNVVIFMTFFLLIIVSLQLF